MVEKAQNEEEKKLQLMKKMILRKGMAPEARERLGRVRVANPEVADRAEAVCIQLIQQGRQVTEESLKQILAKLNPRKEFRIRRR